jgi:ubiquinone/menaquinone biosynthesis C-methylase UbiE
VTTPADFDERYRRVGDPAMRRAERRVIGADYGAVSFTTKAQGDQLAVLLGLGPDHLLLDIGSGAGWPGIYLAAATGSRLILSDVPREGLRAAATRMRAEGVAGGVIVASGSALPLVDGSVDAVTCSDVFC